MALGDGKVGIFGIAPTVRASCERCLLPRVAGGRFCHNCGKSLRMAMAKSGYLQALTVPSGPWEFLRSVPLNHRRMKDGFEAAHPELRRDEKDHQ